MTDNDFKAPEVEAVESKLAWVGEKLADLDYRLTQLEGKQDEENEDN